MLPLQSLFQDFFLQEKYIRAGQNTLPSAEHLLSAQQCMQQHTHKPVAAFLPQQPYFGTRVKRLLVPPVKSPWVPLWIIMLEILEGVVVPAQEVAAPFEGCNLVPGEVQLLAARHHDWAGCCHRFVPHICYILTKITLLSLSAFLLLACFYLPYSHTQTSLIYHKQISLCHHTQNFGCILLSTWLQSTWLHLNSLFNLSLWLGRKAHISRGKNVSPKGWCLEWVRWTMLT